MLSCPLKILLPDENKLGADMLVPGLSGVEAAVLLKRSNLGKGQPIIDRLSTGQCFGIVL
jgi:hypothetical protein